MTAKMEVADPYYRDGDKTRRDKVQELLDNSPYIKKANTPAELARKIEVDVESFLSTVERYNKAFDDGLERTPRPITRFSCFPSRAKTSAALRPIFAVAC